MPTKRFALIPTEREKPCDHKDTCAWTGVMPCTGVWRCRMCGTTWAEAPASRPLTVLTAEQAAAWKAVRAGWESLVHWAAQARLRLEPIEHERSSNTGEGS